MIPEKGCIRRGEENTHGNSAIADGIFRKLFLEKQNENLQFIFEIKKCTNLGKECRNSGLKKRTFQGNYPQFEWREDGGKRVMHVVIHIINIFECA